MPLLRDSLFSAVLLSYGLFSPAGFAQPSSPTFVAADVHRTSGNADYRDNALPGGRYQYRNATLATLISAGWGIHQEAVYGGPAWISTDRFDVIAQLPPNATVAGRALMLRTLLTERFGLVTHDDRKSLPVFALIQAVRGAQLKPSAADTPGHCGEYYESGPVTTIAFTCSHTTMAAFGDALREVDSSVTQPVVDLTNLAGSFDFTIRFTPLFEYQKAVAGGESKSGVKLFDALDKLGLKLEARQHVVPVLVIDRADRNPAPNPPDTAQELPPVVEEFEVAEIKPGKTGGRPTTTFRAGGVIEMQGFTLRQLIRYAFDLAPERIANGPKWIDADVYDIVAKAPGASSSDDLLVMLRPLLIEKFHLVTHDADQPVTVFFLTANKKPKLVRSDLSARSECVITRGQTGTGGAAMPLKVYTCRNTTMARFAELIYTQAGLPQPVIDQTGLTGAYDFTLSWTRADVARAAADRKGQEGNPDDPTGAISIFDAVERDLGLKLEGGKKFPLRTLVIDRADPIAPGN